jgi:hypothetical protein
MDGLIFCNECPFLCYHKKTKKLCCGPYEYTFKKEDFNKDNKIIVPNWCGNKLKNEK